MKSTIVFEEKEKAEILKRFMKEFFPFNILVKSGFFTKEMKGDYKTQAKRVCTFFSFKTVYEYGSQEIVCHITTTEKIRTEPFITVIENIYN